MIVRMRRRMELYTALLHEQGEIQLDFELN